MHSSSALHLVPDDPEPVDAAALDRLFGALADPTRRALLVRLARGDATVSQLAAPFDMSLPGVSKHLRVLERAGLVVRTVEGRARRCALTPEPLGDARQWLDAQCAFWDSSLAALAAYVEAPPPGDPA